MPTRTRIRVPKSSKPFSKPVQTRFLQGSSFLQTKDNSTEENQSSLMETKNFTPPVLSHSFGQVSVISPSLSNIQTKLTIGQPNDKYEQEADRVADQVMGMSEPQAQMKDDIVQPSQSSTIQRLCSECEEEVQRQPIEEEEEEEVLQTKPLAGQITPLVQRQAEPMEEEKEEEKTLQTKSVSNEQLALSPNFQNHITSLQGKGQPLHQSERTFFEPRFGTDFSQVRVHANQQDAETARNLNARAFTMGHNVVFGEGQYNPQTSEGISLLAHELTHVVQQTHGTQLQRSKNSSPPDVQRQSGSPTALGSVTGSDQSAPSPSRYRIRIVGHASPRWRRPGASTPASRNLALSKSRARAVEDAIRSLFRLREIPVEFDLSSKVIDSDSDSSLAIDWRGMEETLEEAGKNPDANDPALRRVDVEVDVLESAFDIGGFSEVVTLPTATSRWAIKVDVIEGAMGGAASMGQGELKNRDTGQIVKGRWIAGGGGGGIDLPIPSVSPGSWTNFETTSKLTFASFEGTPVRLSSLAIGIGIGYGIAEFRFVYFMDESVTLSGVSFNQWGVGGSVTSGPWHFTEPIPAPPAEAQEHEVFYETTVGTQFGHRVLFSTGEDTISVTQLDSLAEFVERLP